MVWTIGVLFLGALLVVAFLFLTAPIAAHRIARAGYLSGAPEEECTALDELEGQYDGKTKTLSSPRRLK